MVIEVLTAATLNTVQDCGRAGQRRFGVGSSGAMDAVALRAGNLLLGNDESAAGIEVQVFPFAVRFADAHAFAVTGADCRASLDGKALPPWWTADARPDQVLRLDAPDAGARSYLSVGGGVDVAIVLGSRSTHLRAGFGGYEGRALREGDQLFTGVPSPLDGAAFGIAGPPRRAGCEVEIRAIKAADYDDFPEETQDGFWSSTWRILAQSNRHGYRLNGPSLRGADRFDIRSSPIMPGIVQVPPGGNPIVQMSDANSAGGYPKMATVIDADLCLLAQARPGSDVRFRQVDGVTAAAAQHLQTEFLTNVRRMAVLWRRGLAVTGRIG